MEIYSFKNYLYISSLKYGPNGHSAHKPVDRLEPELESNIHLILWRHKILKANHVPEIHVQKFQHQH